jgi:NAD(P)-dependent dehydrogenase (short-subunit alcohol dehydrogenase family)
MSTGNGKRALIIGASRGLGYALTAEFLSRGWQVTATERHRSALHELAEAAGGRLAVENVDITVPEHVTALRERLAGARFDCSTSTPARITPPTPRRPAPTCPPRTSSASW